MHLWILVLSGLAYAGFVGPESFEEVVARAYPDISHAPQFNALPTSPQIGVEGNDTASMKVLDLKISRYPLRPGQVTFELLYWLERDIPIGTQLQLIGFAGNDFVQNVSLDLCPYLELSRLYCPLKAFRKPSWMKQVLEIPDTADPGRFSFVAKVTAPRGEYPIAHVAGIVDLENHKTHLLKVEGDHDEL